MFTRRRIPLGKCGQLHPSNHAGIVRNGRDLYQLMDMVDMLKQQLDLLQRNLDQVSGAVGRLPITE